MTIMVNVHEAKTHLSRLLQQVADGEDIIIAKAGRPVARLLGISGTSTPRKPGTAKGMFTLSDDFDAPLPREILRGFE